MKKDTTHATIQRMNWASSVKWADPIEILTVFGFVNSLNTVPKKSKKNKITLVELSQPETTMGKQNSSM